MADDTEKGKQPTRSRWHALRPRRSQGVVAVKVVAAVVVGRLGLRLARALVGGERGKDDNVNPPSQYLQNDSNDKELDFNIPPRDQWLCTSDPAPSEPPAGFKLAASTQLPISVFDLYARFISTQSTFLRDYHTSEGQQGLRMPPWQQHGPEFTRTVTFVQPRKGVQPNDTRCVQQQRYSVHLPPSSSSDGTTTSQPTLLLQTSMHMLDIPFKDCFTVATWWRAVPQGSASCQLDIFMGVPFTKWVLVKGIIEMNSFTDCKAFYEGLVDRLAAAQPEPAPFPYERAVSLRMADAAGSSASAAAASAGSSGGSVSAAGGNCLGSGSVVSTVVRVLGAPMRAGGAAMSLLLTGSFGDGPAEGPSGAGGAKEGLEVGAAVETQRVVVQQASALRWQGALLLLLVTLQLWVLQEVVMLKERLLMQ